MLQTEKTQIIQEYSIMVRDGILSLSLIIGGNFLRLRIDELLEKIHQFSDPNSVVWEIVLKSTSWVTMIIGSLVGCAMLFNFIELKIKNYKALKRNKDS